MATRQKVKFNNKLKKELLELMCEGNDVSTICEKFPGKFPVRETIYRESLKDPDFAKKMDQAYTVLLMIRHDEARKLANSNPMELYPDIEDWRHAEKILDRRIKHSYWEIEKMGPILSKRFNRTEKLELSGEVTSNVPQFAVINYYKDEIKELKEVKDITDDKENKA